MSYCRFGDDSDVYIYQNMEYKYVCCWCEFNDNLKGWREDFRCDTIPEMLAHLDMHIAAGHQVPQRAIDGLKRESRNFVTQWYYGFRRWVGNQFHKEMK